MIFKSTGRLLNFVEGKAPHFDQTESRLCMDRCRWRGKSLSPASDEPTIRFADVCRLNAETRHAGKVDYERYAHFLDTADLSEDQKREFLQTLWNIIVEFVSMGFGVHPVQLARDACGQIKKNPGNPPILGPDEVLLKTDILTKNFSDTADSETDTAVEGVKQ